MFNFKRETIKRDISLALVLKFILFFGLWALFFAHPKDERLTKTDLVTHYLRG